MKKNSVATYLALAVASAGLLGVKNAQAITTAQADSLRTTISQTAALEMPAKAAELVATAKADDRSDVAQVVVHASVDRRPTLAASVVAAVAGKAPGAAAVSAVEAASLQPKLIEAITKAAVHAAPNQAGEIVAALCQKFQTQYNRIALAASEAAPQSGAAIMNAVASSIPSLKPVIEHNLTSPVDVKAVVAVTDQYVLTTMAALSTSADRVLTAAGPVSDTASLGAPSFGAPFQAVTPSSPTISSGEGSVFPTNGVRYSGG